MGNSPRDLVASLEAALAEAEELLLLATGLHLQGDTARDLNPVQMEAGLIYVHSHREKVIRRIAEAVGA